MPLTGQDQVPVRDTASGEGHDFLARDKAEAARTATTAWLAQHLAVTATAVG